MIALDNARIIGVAEDFTEAKRKREELLVSSSLLISEEKITLFLVLRHKRLRIRTLRLRSLKELLWKPIYPVTLQTDRGEMKDCQMLIDSGANISLITFRVGKDLGLSRSDEEVLLFAQGASGKISYLLRSVRCFSHRISAKRKTIDFQTCRTNGKLRNPKR